MRLRTISEEGFSMANQGDRPMPMKNFTEDFQFQAIFTREEALSGGVIAKVQFCSPWDIADHLATSEKAAVILLGSNDNYSGEQKFDPPIFVAHAGDPDHFYASVYPPTDPDDVIVSGEDLPETLRAATIEYYE